MGDRIVIVLLLSRLFAIPKCLGVVGLTLFVLVFVGAGHVQEYPGRDNLWISSFLFGAF